MPIKQLLMNKDLHSIYKGQLIIVIKNKIILLLVLILIMMMIKKKLNSIVVEIQKNQ